MLTRPLPSYLKIGACRHGDRCSRKHTRPQFSQTLVIQNMYQNPAHIPGSTSNPHLRPAGAAPLDANPTSGLSDTELEEYFNQFCESRPDVCGLFSENPSVSEWPRARP